MKKFKIILTLFSFAFTQPLFEILNKNQEFFIASDLSSFDIFIFSFFLAVIIPTLLYLTILILSKIHKFIGISVYSILIFLLIVPGIIGTLAKIEKISSNHVLLTSFIISLIFTVLIFAIPIIRKFISFLSVSTIIFLGLFLIQNKLVVNNFNSQFHNEIKEDIKINHPSPVVFIVFDEFSLNSILDKNGNIDRTLFPNFASLLDNFTWYKNATTVADSTTTAVPSILTGSYPKENSLATASFYPQNIFSILGGEYKITADEIYTDLCPEKMCFSSKEKSSKNFNIFISDIFIIYKNFILTKGSTSDAPSITDKWHKLNSNPAKIDADEVSKLDETRDQLFYSFLDSINNNNYPEFYYHHLELPHIPFSFLPSGNIYRTTTGELGRVDNSWGNNLWLVNQSYQRHLLQASFVDKLVGQLISKLRETDMFERSIVVITADHGISFIPNDNRRAITKNNFQDIMSVPLFIKLPDQKSGLVSEIQTQSIDILPTIIDELDIVEIPKMDGVSLLENNQNKSNKIIYYEEATKSMIVGEEELRIRQSDSLKKKFTNIFDSDTDYERLYKIGDYPELINRSVEDNFIIINSDTKTSINFEASYSIIDSTSHFIPAEISGFIKDNADSLKNSDLAISLNGVIRGVTKTTQLENGNLLWSSIIREQYFTDGKNKIDVYKIISNNKEIKLIKLKSIDSDNILLIQNNNKYIIRDDSNKVDFSIESSQYAGSVDNINHDNGVLHISGWGINPSEKESAENIVIFVNNKFSGMTKPSQPRHDVVKSTGIEAYLYSGFGFYFPLDENKEIPNIKIYSLSKNNKAWEIK